MLGCARVWLIVSSKHSIVVLDLSKQRYEEDWVQGRSREEDRMEAG
jgi:hypothetical protein